MQFVSTPEELRDHYRAASEGSLRKEMKSLEAHSKGFLKRSPFVLIGSSDGNGNADVTPKGDRPGFVAVLGDTTIAIPDRPGNNRLDTWENVVRNPSVGLLFLIPGMDETLRINGEARITFDAELRDLLKAEGKLPASVMVVEIKAVYMHCAKAFMRSDLWKPATWPDRASLPTLGQILKDQLALTDTAEATDRRLLEDYRKSMW